MAFSVAKEPRFAPVVIYLDECEIYFQSSKKKKKANAALKLQKDLLIYKNQSLSHNDRVLVIGCSRCPLDSDMKTIKWKGSTGKPEKQGTTKLHYPLSFIFFFFILFCACLTFVGFFERSIHIPNPSYTDRIILWKTFIKERIKVPLKRDFNYSLLSQESEGEINNTQRKDYFNIIIKLISSCSSALFGKRLFYWYGQVMCKKGVD